MGIIILLQVALDIGLIALATVLLIERSKAKTEDDVRMSRGLQLLTSKIAIIEDLMDRTETSSKQLTQLLEAKQQDVQDTLENVERHLHRVHESIEKSKNVARLFEEKIPHEEIIERQNAQKYLKAAKLANLGQSVDEISTQVDIPRGELELIVKLNRKNLVASETSWLEDDVIREESLADAAATLESHHSATRAPSTESSNSEAQEEIQNSQLVTVAAAEPAPPQAMKTIVYSSQTFAGSRLQDAPTVRPVVFKKIDPTRP